LRVEQLGGLSSVERDEDSGSGGFVQSRKSVEFEDGNELTEKWCNRKEFEERWNGKDQTKSKF
jgi:hypothetical protein